LIPALSVYGAKDRHPVQEDHRQEGEDHHPEEGHRLVHSRRGLTHLIE